MTNLIRRAALLALASTCLLATAFPSTVQTLPQSESASPSPNEVLRAAQTIFIRTKSVYFKPETLENSLLEREEFQQWGIAITRNEADADLIIEVGRKLFTTSFIFSIIDPRHQRVVASGRVNSIGGTVEGKISDSFIKRMRQVRQSVSTVDVKSH
jgi:hypothetical protein